MPVERPVITPVPATIDALAGLLLDHVPPVAALPSVNVVPTQTARLPVIAPVTVENASPVEAAIWGLIT